ncbi:MAG: archaeosine biosynthesis radical SAM protein RaSEA [Candidatus Thermoplasmatota archaeon]|nr:archaeosine biosynthesis radical SAM protein RaSEA [Candidatus Thermoplasmatota archaeon]
MRLKKEIKEAHRNTSRSEKKDLITTWTGQEFYPDKDELADVFALIFRTRGCSWSYESGCSMCGYYTQTNPEIGKKELEIQLEEAIKKYEDQEIVKIYTSGSFFDSQEMPDELAEKILERFGAKAEKIIVESRPEYIEQKRVEDYSRYVNTLEVAIGLESADDFILKNCINKGFTYDDYRKSAEKISDYASIRTYLLMKPPFLLEKEAIEEMIRSIEKISEITDIISINPVNVQNGTLLEKLWHEGTYRPPRLWSIIEVLSRAESEKPIVVSQAGLGSDRGAHNCGECDEVVLEKIENYNKTQNESKFDPLPDCGCRERWKKEMKIEPFLFFRGSTRTLRDRYTGYL